MSSFPYRFQGNTIHSSLRYVHGKCLEKSILFPLLFFIETKFNTLFYFLFLTAFIKFLVRSNTGPKNLPV